MTLRYDQRFLVQEEIDINEYPIRRFTLFRKKESKSSLRQTPLFLLSKSNIKFSNKVSQFLGQSHLPKKGDDLCLEREQWRLI